MAGPPGRDRLLAAAERLFAEQGIEATSARAINAAADLSPAALHYHFGNKDNIVEEVLRRRIEAVNETRTEMVTEFVDRGDTKDMHRLAEIIVLPLVDYVMDPATPGHWYIRFLSRLYVEKRDMLVEFLEREQGEGVRLFDGMIRDAGPGLPDDEVRRRRIIAGEIIVHEMARIGEAVAHEPEKRGAAERMIGALVSFVAGGLAAPMKKANVADPTSAPQL